MLNNLLQIHLKLLQKEQFKKPAELTGALIGNKNDDKITRPQKPHQIIIQKQMKKYFITPELRHKVINY